MPSPMQFMDTLAGVTSHTAAPTAGNARANWGTLTAVGGDNAGLLGATSSATPAAGAVLDVTFANPFGQTPRSVVIVGNLQAWATSVTATGFTLTSLATAAAQAYNWYYIVVP